MIVPDSKFDVESSGIKSSNFKIAFNKKMFEMLSSGIYSDNLVATIRELSCNAWDAHQLAGKKDIPFDIHLPNQLELYFEVKDYGTGIDNDKIKDIYTTYGASTKDQDNVAIGCFGIGSKSPFSYTDNFQVENRWSGFKTSYTAFIDATGTPSFSEPVSKVPTTEPNGLTVRFPVKKEDIYKFTDAAKKVYSSFATKPNIKGAYGFVLNPEPEYLLKNSDFGMPKYNTGTPRLLMGNIYYPINILNILPKSSGYSYYSSTYGKGTPEFKIDSVLRWGINLYVNIGDVDITASRESLSYDDGTIKLIKEKCLAAYDILADFITKEVQNQPDIYKAKCKLNEINESWRQFDFNATWNGKFLTGDIPTIYNKVQIEFKNIRNSYGNKYLHTKIINLVPKNNFVYFVNDSSYAESRVKNWLISNPNKYVLYFDKDPDPAWVSEYSIPLEKTSTLPTPPKKVGTRSSSTKAKVYQLDTSKKKGAIVDFWKPVEIDLESKDTFVYVNILYFKYFTEEGGDSPPHNLLPILEKLEKLKTKVNIYGIRPNDEKLIKDSKGKWIKLWDFVKEKNKEFEKLYKDKCIKYMHYRNFNNSNNALFLTKLKSKPQSEMGKFVSYFNECKQASLEPEVVNYYYLYEKNIDIKDKDKLNHEFGNLTNKYKILNSISWYSSSLVPDLNHYLELEDKDIK